MRFDKILRTGLILSPLFIVLVRIYKIPFSNSQQFEIFFQFFVIMALALVLCGRFVPQGRRNNVWMGAFLIWSFVSFLTHPTIVVNGQIVLLWPVSNRYLVNIFWAGLLLFLINQYVREEWIPSILKTISVMAMVMAGFIVMQMVGLWPIKIGNTIIGQPLDVYGKCIKMSETDWWRTGFHGFLGHRTHTGAYLAMTVPLFFLYGKIKKFPIGVVILPLFIISTRSVMATISVFAGILFYEWFRPDRNMKRIKVEVISAIIVIGLVVKYVHFPGWMPRWVALKHIFSNLSLWGHGLGSFLLAKVPSMHDGSVASGWVARAHNEYAQVMYELGIVGLVIVLGYMATRFEKFMFMVKPSKEVIAIIACLVALCTNSLGNFIFHHGALVFVGLTLIGLADIYLYKKEVVA